MILLLHYHTGRANGTLTNMIDTYFNLKSFGVECDFKIISGDKVHTTIQFIRENEYFGDKEILKCVTKDLSFEADIIICSAKLLVDIHEHNIKINCGRMIVLDSLDVFKLSQGIVQFSIVCQDTIFMCNPANEVPFKTYEYYHKFSKKRLDTLKKRCELIIYNRMSRDNIVVNDIHFDNIGKVLWEGIYKDTKMLYHPDALKVEDGLCYYMNLFGLDGHKAYEPLPVTREQIQEKLFMKKDDKLLCIL